MTTKKILQKKENTKKTKSTMANVPFYGLKFFTVKYFGYKKEKSRVTFEASLNYVISREIKISRWP